MTECIVKRSSGYTVMSNHHLRNQNLSLKAVGLLSLMLSLPDNWDYTIAGLATICKEGKAAIRAAIGELEQAGYITRTQLTDEGGKFGKNQYIIRETPELPEQAEAEEAEPLSGFLTTGNPSTEKPSSENRTQINKDKIIKDQKKTRVEKGSYTLDDGQMDQLIMQNIGILGDTSGWGRDEKNAIYRLVKEFYAPRECNGKPPKHTARGVGGLFRKLAPSGNCSYQAASDMLLTAIERGWTSVYPKDERRPGASAPTPQRPAADLGDEWA